MRHVNVGINLSVAEILPLPPLLPLGRHGNFVNKFAYTATTALNNKKKQNQKLVQREGEEEGRAKEVQIL